MRNYFDALLELLRQYVEVSINNRSEIAKINNNGDMSQIAKEREVKKCPTGCRTKIERK